MSQKSLCPQCLNLCNSKKGFLHPDYLLRMVHGWGYSWPSLSNYVQELFGYAHINMGQNSGGSSLTAKKISGQDSSQYFLISQYRCNQKIPFPSTWSCNNSKQGVTSFIILKQCKNSVRESFVSLCNSKDMALHMHTESPMG